MLVAERIRKGIEANIIKADCTEFNITVSIGMAELTAAQLACGKDLGHTLAMVLDNADSAMYAAKNRGKNCVVKFED